LSGYRFNQFTLVHQSTFNERLQQNKCHQPDGFPVDAGTLMKRTMQAKRFSLIIISTSPPVRGVQRSDLSNYAILIPAAKKRCQQKVPPGGLDGI
jgi:hypothetical protein